MKAAACIKKLGLEAVKEAFIQQTRTHEDFPCFCGEHCSYLKPNGACSYEFKEVYGK